jgi:acetyl-CoA synthetase
METKISADFIVQTGVVAAEAKSLAASLNAILERGTPTERWAKLTREVLRPQVPFEVHQEAFRLAYRDWNCEKFGPPPAWFPDRPESTNLFREMHDLKLPTYSQFHQWTLDHRAEFWERMVKRLGIVFKRPMDSIADFSHGAEKPRWLVNAELNIVDSCFLAEENATAVVYQTEGGPLTKVTYGELRALANRIANGIVNQGFKPGDALAIDMSMTLEAVAIYLGVILAGCVAVSIADSFAAEEIKTRLALTKTKGIFTQNYVERAGKKIGMYEKVVAADAPRAIVVPWGDSTVGELRAGDVAWKNFLSAETTFASISAHPESPVNLLFSSGTTGEPKVIPWSQTTPLKAAVDGYFHHDIQPGDVVAWPTNLGWMMGPWLIYASLLNRGTMALFYGAPLGHEFGQFVERAGVRVLGLVPSIVKAWRATQCMKGVDWSRLKAFSSTGECSNAEDYLFLMSLAQYRPVIEYCGGTEIGGGFLTGTLLQPASPATFTTTSVGLDIEIRGEDGQVANKGEVFLKPPSIGLSLELLNRDHHQVYFEGVPRAADGSVLRRHGDEVERLANGYLRALGRADDTMNLGGIKVSSAEIERTLNQVDDVVETAAIAVNPPGGGPSLLVVFTVLKGVRAAGELKTAMQKQLREKLNPLFKIEDVVVVNALPRTASNKVMRRTLRAQYSFQG